MTEIRASQVALEEAAGQVDEFMHRTELEPAAAAQYQEISAELQKIRADINESRSQLAAADRLVSRELRLLYRTADRVRKHWQRRYSGVRFLRWLASPAFLVFLLLVTVLVVWLVPPVNQWFMQLLESLMRLFSPGGRRP